MSLSVHLRTLGLMGVAACALAACGDAPVDPRTQPPLVRVATAVVDGVETRQYSGIISARVQSDLAFRVSGKVVARLVNAGQSVRRGQPLMRIDASDYALAAAASDAAVGAARARAVQTGADEARYRDLVSAGAVSASAYGQIRAAAQSARAELNAAQARARISRNDKGYTVLVADADGTVSATLAEPGQVVSAGQPVVRLARSGPREAIVALPETVRPPLGSLAVAQTYGGLSGSGQLRQLSDLADPATRTFEARYVLGGAAAGAPMGSTVTVRIGAQSQSSRIVVPLGAVHDAGRGPGVWIVTGGKTPKLVWRSVTIASVTEETAQLSAGLREGERFVALGAHLLRQGQPVRIAPVGKR